MDFQNHRFKLLVSISLMCSEKDRIKQIITSYNMRLEHIYNNICSTLDQ